MSISPFQIDIDKAILEDLRSRLLATRWPDQLDGSDWIYGTNVDYLKELVSYWINEFDWFAQQEMLNKFHHFTTIVEGHDVHFIKEKIESLICGLDKTPTCIILSKCRT